MRVIHLITDLDVGGAELVLYRLLAGLQARGLDNHVVSIKRVGAVGDWLAKDGIPVYSLGCTGRSLRPAAVLELTRLVSRLRPDVLQTWMYHANLLGSLICAVLPSVKLIWNLRHESPRSADLRPRTRCLAVLCAWLSGWSPHRIVCCSQVAASNHARAGYAHQKMVVIPNGVDTDRFRPDPGAKRGVLEEFGLDPASLLVLLGANYRREKGYDLFLAAARRVAAGVPNARFLMCGLGVDESNDSLTSRIRHERLIDRCRLLGVREDMPRLLAAADVVVSASSCEAFPNVLAEAMSCASLCVGPDLAAVKELLGGSGLLFRAGDPASLAQVLIEALRLPLARRRHLGAAARQRILSTFSQERMWERYLELYSELVAF